MKNHDLEKLATLLKESDQYRAIKRYLYPMQRGGAGARLLNVEL